MAELKWDSNIKLEPLHKIIKVLGIDYQTFIAFIDSNNDLTKLIVKLSLVYDEERYLEFFNEVLAINVEVKISMF